MDRPERSCYQQSGDEGASEHRGRAQGGRGQRRKETSLLHRQQIMFKYTHLIRENWDRLAASITLEQGKTFGDARGDVLRGLQVAETACGITTQMTGEVLQVAKDMETRSYREPLGVVAAICPFSE
jgi:malonate-semialdehyde dehydrogenase (acetylating)/methylmalonate-semialdehyde dehydrogenase